MLFEEKEIWNSWHSFQDERPVEMQNISYQEWLQMRILMRLSRRIEIIGQHRGLLDED